MWATISVRKKEMIQILKNVFIYPLEGMREGGKRGKEEESEILKTQNWGLWGSVICWQILHTREGSSPRPFTNEIHYSHYIRSF